VKVFFDTNVLISGFTTRGLCADVIRLVLAEHELITGEVILGEMERVLSKKIGLPALNIEEVLSFLQPQTVEPRPNTIPAVPIRDEDDRLVLASALAAKCDVLVTGDKDLLDAAAHVSDLTITDPRGFWHLVKKSPK
jgi:uncharacterized protein